MKCIFCGHSESKVVDSRLTGECNSIRRRRECLQCGKRWTTYETVEQTPVLVIKKNRSIQPFDRNKIVNGIVKSCEKRPVSLVQIEQIACEVEKEIKDSLKQEIESLAIGEMILKRLKPVDEISYIRFASVYHEFSNIDSFIQFLNAEK